MKWDNLEDNLIDKQNKKRLFSLINKLPLLYEIVILEHYWTS
jgi:hypothetical protein